MAVLEPVHLSFSGVLLITPLWQLMSLRAPGSISKRIANWEAHMQRLLLPARRSHRNYPWAVKIKISNSDRKQPSTVAGRAKFIGIATRSS
jgi:hypothetical protein